MLRTLPTELDCPILKVWAANRTNPAIFSATFFGISSIPKAENPWHYRYSTFVRGTRYEFPVFRRRLCSALSITIRRLTYFILSFCPFPQSYEERDAHLKFFLQLPPQTLGTSNIKILPVFAYNAFQYEELLSSRSLSNWIDSKRSKSRHIIYHYLTWKAQSIRNTSSFGIWWHIRISRISIFRKSELFSIKAYQKE